MVLIKTHEIVTSIKLQNKFLCSFDGLTFLNIYNETTAIYKQQFESWTDNQRLSRNDGKGILAPSERFQANVSQRAVAHGVLPITSETKRIIKLKVKTPDVTMHSIESTALNLLCIQCLLLKKYTRKKF